MGITPLSKNHGKRIRSLHQKKFREEEGTFVAEGFNAFDAAIRMTHHPVNEVITEQDHVARIQQSLKQAGRGGHGIAVYTCSRKEMERISTEITPQGIITVCHRHHFAFDTLKKHSRDILIYCEKISDPGNLGAILRAAAWFGITQTILGPGCVDPFNTKVIRSSAGTIFDMEIYTSVTPRELCEFSRRKDFQMTATVPRGGTPINNWKKPNKNIMLFGHEAYGLSPELMERAHCHVSIPGSEGVESLNLAVAAAIIMYEVAGKP
jgi:TrmH family RNA methyltransferase